VDAKVDEVFRGTPIIMDVKLFSKLDKEQDINMKEHKISNLANPVNDLDAANKKYVLERCQIVYTSTQNNDREAKAYVDRKLNEFITRLNNFNGVLNGFIQEKMKQRIIVGSQTFQEIKEILS